jgi:hypothetical protein
MGRRQNQKKEERTQTTGRRGTKPYRDPDSPPNDHVRKDPDEVYGDTEIPHRGSK